MNTANASTLQYKVKLLKNIIFMVTIIVVIMLFVRLYEENYLQSANNVVLIVVMIFSYFQLNNVTEKKFYVIARLVFLSDFATLFVLMLYSQERVTQFIWFGTTFYLLFYLLDKRESWKWFAAFITILFGLYIYDSTLLRLNGKEFFTWIFNMFVIVIIANKYEEIKEESTQRLLDIQYILADEVKSKTFELQKLNENLERKVAQEIERNRAQEQMMMEQTRMAQMGEMISMIAHQWRQPLASISAVTNSLIIKNTRGKYDVALFDDRLHKIADYSQHLSTTIDDFRNFFKTHKTKTGISLEAMVGNALNIIQISLENKNIKVTTDFNCHKTVNIYTNELQQVVLNLLKNAEDVLLENKIENAEITIRTFLENGHAVLSVEDNGGGIDEAIIGKIFDPYFSTKHEKDGTGLGLYMSKTIVEEHCKGELHVKNGSRGALFTIVIKEIAPE